MENRATDTILELRGLLAGYGERRVVGPIDLGLQRGEFVCLLGPNGAGKTTILRTISAHIPALGGEIFLNGKALQGYTRGELARLMAVVLTDRVSPPLFTAFEFVSLGRYPYTGLLGRLKAQDRQAVEEALAAVNGHELRDRVFSRLSDGERQKVLLARALCQEPKLLLLDEPTAHLDLKHRVEVMSILRRLCMEKGITILCSMHDVDLAAKVADKVVLVRSGRIVSSGPPEKALTPVSVARLYDFDSAVFSLELGTIELKGQVVGPRVFVVAGRGRGCPVYRALARKGFGITTGVLFENDMDHHVAKTLGATVIGQEAAEKVCQTSLSRALEGLERCIALFDARPLDMGCYQGNQRLVQAAHEMGMKVFPVKTNGALDHEGWDGLFVGEAITMLQQTVQDTRR